MKKSLMVTLSLVLFLTAAATSIAETITYVGGETGGAGQTFRDTAVAKAYNTVSGEYYGSAGYILWRAGTANGNTTLASGTSIADGLGGPTSLPTYITSIVTTGSVISFRNTYCQTSINNPTVTPADNLPVDLGAGGLCYNSSNNASTFNFFTLTMGSIPTNVDTVRIGVMCDTFYNKDLKKPLQWLDYLKMSYIDGSNTGSADVTISSADGYADLYFFDIKGLSSGATITVSASAGDGGYPIISGLTFDNIVVPEPGSISLLVCGLAGLLAYAWRRRKN